MIKSKMSYDENKIYNIFISISRIHGEGLCKRDLEIVYDMLVP